MSNIYSFLRYTVFGLFIACNAVISSVTVWNFSLAQGAGIPFPADPYLIFIGVSGLVVIFSLIFVELVRRNAITVWVECSWSGTLLLLDLIGAAVLSGTVPVGMCSKRVVRNFKGSCVSTQVILAFSWISAIILFAYFLLVVITACLHARENRRIWRCSIHNLLSFDCRRLPSAPTTPILPQFIHGQRAIIAPKPHRPAPNLIYAHRSGLSPDYRIEHFQSPPAPPPAIVRQPSGRSQYLATAFYNQAVQSALLTQSRLPPARDSLPDDQRPTPPPLRDWPRVDVMNQPLKRRTHNTQLSMPSLAVHSSLPPHPGRPRKRSESGGNFRELRPPPLDLSKISAFNNLNGQR